MVIQTLIKNDEKVRKGMLKSLIKLFIVLLGLGRHSLSTAAVNNWQMNMHRGVTPLSKEIYNLHMLAMAVCAVIGLIVFGVMIYALIHHRKTRGYKAATFHGNHHLEIIWSVIPFLILVGLAIPATRVLIRMDDTEDSAVTVKIVGYQWKWQYQYLNQGISYFSTLATPFEQIQNLEKKDPWYLLEVDKPLVLPVNKKIRFLVTSNDVIHSWWVPQLGVKRDAIPGFMYEAWTKIEKPGTYRGQCAELCGINHGFMPIVVEAVSDSDFNQWISQQTKVKDDYATSLVQAKSMPTLERLQLMKLGRQKYEQICAACHRSDGRGLPPMYPPLKGSSVAVGKPLSRHILTILDGVPGSAMQPYKDQLTDVEIAAIATYERNAWGNNSNDTIQPAEVAAVRLENSQPPVKMVNKARVGGLR